MTARSILRLGSIDAAFMNALQAGSFTGRVHSVFHRVVNLERAGGRLFTLAARELDNAPDTAIAMVSNFGALGLDAGDVFSSIDGELSIGAGIGLHWAAAPIWQARLPRYATTRAGMVDQLRAARSTLARGAVGGGPFGRLAGEAACAPEIGAALEERSTRLLEALAQGRDDDACRHAVSLLGLGPGLTPSGDDFLVGLFAVLNVAGSPCCGRLNGGVDVLAHAADATHAISLAALSAAAEGRVRESISELIEALIHGSRQTLTGPLRRVLAVGATSGADIVAGILAGLELNLRLPSNHQAEATQRPRLATAA